MSSIKLSTFYGREVAHCKYPEDALRLLGGPSEIIVQGKDTSRTRVLVTLLHANEPSGLNAILKYIKQDPEPITNTVFIIASVNAALTEPLFYHRMLPGQKDLNRCFTVPPTGVQGALARSIKERILHHQPELVVDMHNTSGDGPAFCVTTKNAQSHINLASMFSHRIIVTDIVLGSLMEQALHCPCITFEAGGSNNDNADNCAYEGLVTLLNADNLDQPVREMEILSHPRRLELLDSTSLNYGQQPSTTAQLTLRDDIERFNFGVTPANTQLGWTTHPLSQLVKLDKQELDVEQFFEVRDNRLITREPLRLFMVTTREDIARSDCLFYFQR